MKLYNKPDFLSLSSDEAVDLIRNIRIRRVTVKDTKDAKVCDLSLEAQEILKKLGVTDGST